MAGAGPFLLEAKLTSSWGAGRERQLSSGDGQWLVESHFEQEQENQQQQAPCCRAGVTA